MMINKRLINTVSGSKKYIAGNIIFQWISLLSNIVLMFGIAMLLGRLMDGTADTNFIITIAVIAAAVLIIRYICTIASTKMSYLSSKSVKKVLRKKLYEKLLRIGPSYKENVMSSEAVQVSVEGVDQLETYFGAYLPQFFYAMIAPLTLFIVLCFVHVPTAIVLLICVPMIPMAIAAVQTWAKKLFSKYWGQYTSLGDTFLENLQGLTTLKIYQADEYKNKVMNEEAESFRKITMKVLTMQLNSITIMDLVAYGGAALGVIMSTLAFSKGTIDLTGCLSIILLSADFFIPMRKLGSFFHVAMNGMAASDKIFRILDLPEENQENKKSLDSMGDIELKDVHFSYDKDREILHGINMSFPEREFTSIVGESGCGKSTVAALLTGKNKHYEGSITINGTELRDIKEKDLLRNIAYISNNSYLFRGTVRDNLLMGKPDATDEELWKALDRVNLSDFLKAEQGLDTVLTDKAGNISGGQHQRLALARALLFDAPAYIFDEATSNIDIDSEEKIMEQIRELKKTKTVILISHRLANVEDSDNIYIIENGSIKESGTHAELVKKNGSYAKLLSAQRELENYKKAGENR